MGEPMNLMKENRMHKVWLGIIAGTMLVTVNVGCSRKAAPTAPAPVAKATPPVTPAANERFLRISLETEPAYLDPGMLTETASFDVAIALFEGLVGYDPKTARAIPALASHWEISEDRTVYTFHLQPTAQWSNGEALTAQDFVYAWERVLNPATGAEYAFALHYIKNGKAYNQGTLKDPSQLGVRALDAHTLQVTLEQPTPFFLDFLCFASFYPVPRAVVEQYGSQWTKPEHIVSNGPFRLTQWKVNDELTVVKNEHYWDRAHVRLPGIRFFPIEDLETALKMYEAGDLDVAASVPDKRIPTLTGRPDFVLSPMLAVDFYRLNVTKPPLNNLKARQALALAIDREAISKEYLQNAKYASASLVPPGVGAYQPASGLVFDPVRAKALLAEAGYKDPATFPTITLYYNTDATIKLAAQIVQRMWKEHLGINAELRNEEYKTLLSRVNTMDYQIARSRWIGDYVDPNTFLELFLSGSTINRTGWANPQFDQLMAQANRAADPAQRNRLLQQAEGVLLNEAAAIPIYIHTKPYLIRPEVQGYFANISDRHPQKGISFADAAQVSQTN